MNQHRSSKTQMMIALFVLIFVNLLFSQEGVPLFTKDFTPEEFAKRRSAVYDAIGANALAVVQGAPSPVGYTRFRQSNEFYYLCGIEAPHAYLLLDGSPRRASLYLPHRNEGRERSEGKVLSAEDADLVKQLSGIEA
ncbi:MAG: aminopeptidase P N-terminal domain-containing protein, partial [bacterium]